MGSERDRRCCPMASLLGHQAPGHHLQDRRPGRDVRDGLPHGARSRSVSTTGSTAGARRSRLVATGRRAGISLRWRASAAWNAQGDRRRRSPSREKQREKRRAAEAKTFGVHEALAGRGPGWPRAQVDAQGIIDRDILPVFRNRLMAEIGPEDLRNLCAKVKARGARDRRPRARHREAGVRLRGLHGEGANPADEVGPRRSPRSWQGPRCRRPRSASCTACWTPPRPCRPSAWRCA